MLFIQATSYAQQDVTLKTDPLFQYYYNVMSEERFKTPQGVLDAYQDYENARIPDQVTTLSNLRPDPSSTYFLNGLPILFVWDYFFHYPKYPSNDYGGSTGTIDGEAICPWDTPIEGLGEWRVQYENLGHLDGKAWCEISFKHPALPPQTCNMCPCPAQTGLQVGNPILPATGQKLQRETDYSESGPGALAVSRTFLTPRAGQPHPVQADFSDNWFFDQAPKIKFHNKFATTVFVHGLAGTIFFKNYPEDPHSKWVSFSSADDLRDDNGTWSYFLAAEDATYTFNEQGDAVKKTERNGRVTTYAYVDHRLTEIANAFQRKISIAYDSDGRAQTITQPDGGVVAYAYDEQGRLASVRFPDGTRRQYRYADGAHPTYLTDVVDEAGMPFAHFTYDSAGRAISTEHAGGAGRYALDYGNFPYYPTITVTDALQHAQRLDYVTRFGRTSVVSSDGVSDGRGAG